MKWEENENNDLFNCVICCVEQKLPILNGIKLHAKKYGRSICSVKKHYYEITRSKNNKAQNDLINSFEDKVVNINAYQSPKLSEKDLELLFRGLVKLIKEQCQSDYKGT